MDVEVVAPVDAQLEEGELVLRRLVDEGDRVEAVGSLG